MDRLDKLIDGQARIEEALLHHHENLDDLNDAVYGNGRKGLREEVAALKAATRVRRNSGKLAATAASLAAGIVIGVVEALRALL